MRKHIHIDDMLFIRIHTMVKHRIGDIVYNDLYYILVNETINETRKQLRSHLSSYLEN